MSDVFELTRAKVEETVEALIKQAELYGSEGDYRKKPGTDPIIYGAYLMLLHTSQTHSDGITGMLRVLRWLSSRLFRLDEE